MKKVRWVSAAAGTALVAATFALPGAGVAYASGNGNVTGNGDVSLLSGNSVNAPVSAPLNLCGISLAVLGFANSHCQGGASSSISRVGDHNHNGNVTGNGNVSAGSGNTLNAPVSAPVNVCGVSGAVGGFANSSCKGGASSSISGVGDHSHNGNVTGNGNVSAVSGNTVNAPVSTPVNLCGISLALLGFSNAECKGGSTSCIGEKCTPPACQGEKCTPPPCEENECHTPPPCTSDCHAPPPCQNNCHTPPPCTSECHTPPPCQNNCHTPPPCTSGCNTPPPCQNNCTQPSTMPTLLGTTLTTATMPSGSLPTTGADLLLLGVAALGTIGVGAGTVALARRRRNGEAS